MNPFICTRLPTRTARLVGPWTNPEVPALKSGLSFMADHDTRGIWRAPSVYCAEAAQARGAMCGEVSGSPQVPPRVSGGPLCADHCGICCFRCLSTSTRESVVVSISSKGKSSATKAAKVLLDAFDLWPFLLTYYMGARGLERSSQVLTQGFADES